MTEPSGTELKTLIDDLIEGIVQHFPVSPGSLDRCEGCKRRRLALEEYVERMRRESDEQKQLIKEWDDWAQKNLDDLGLPFSELWRRAKRAREHPEELLSHEE